MARDDAAIAPIGHTALLEHGNKAPWAVVLFHGYTNHPGQYREFAPLLHALGANVYVPRMPDHGYANRLTNALATLSAEQLVVAAYDAVDIARGLGDRVAVLGISMGGLQAAYAGVYRDDVAVCVPVAPDFTVLQIGFGAMMLLKNLMLALPNVFLWWDPRLGANMHPATAYPRFSTHALMQTLRIGEAIHRTANTIPTRGGRVTTVINRADPAVNGAVAQEVVEQWKRLRASGIELIAYNDLPENHDIIEPDNPMQRTAIVYPRLLEALAIHSS